HLAAASTEVRGIRLIDDTAALLRAPETTFHARDAGLDRLGYNCPNPAIVAALLQRLTELDGVTTYLGRPIMAVTAPKQGADTGHVSVELGSLSDDSASSNLQLTARLAVAADGRRSIARAAADISVRTWDCGQAALTAQFRHTRTHEGISTEFHRPGGPLTTVPLAGNSSALVWLDRPGAVQRRMTRSDDAFQSELEERLNGMLGDVTWVSPRRTFPLQGLVARTFGARRVALIGETAHAFPPIGAQGLNLSLRDVATVCGVVSEALPTGGDIGAGAVTQAYAGRRQVDVATRAYGVDLLGATLTSVLMPTSLLRAPVLHALNALPALKRRLIWAGLGEPYKPAPASASSA
ncbi:MAG: FAD-dependent monooxygenase, partial [Hyphomicrobiaceae bacterium]|nr:FAD-dependent monooxygenase [Hyphomicrobiaceae bacterium]